MLPFLCRSYDRALGRLIARFVRQPAGGFTEPPAVPDSPEELDIPRQVAFEFSQEKAELWKFEAPSPAESIWPESKILRGRALGLENSRGALIVLHGACDNEYTYSRWMGNAFLRHGYRVLIPAAPCHLDRAPPRTFSGAPMFWSTRLTIAGVAQWLTEVRSLIDHLRGDGVETIGLIGYSIGSLTAGLAATLWPDLDFACLLAPVGHHLRAMDHSKVARTIWPWLEDVSPDEAALFDRWAALNRRPVARQSLFLMTLFDDLQPYGLQQDWWNAWDQPAHHEYRHGHMSILFCKQLYRDLDAFAASAVGEPA